MMNVILFNGIENLNNPPLLTDGQQQLHLAGTVSAS